MKWKEGFKEGLSEVAKIGGLGVVSPWALLILLIIVLVVGLIFWAILASYGLTTAFFGFVAGCIFLWFLTKLGLDIGEHPHWCFLPIIFGILGYIAEKFNIWRVWQTVKLNTAPFQFLGLSAETTVGIQIILLIAVLVVCIADFIHALRRWENE